MLTLHYFAFFCFGLESGGSLASEFLTTGMCQGGINENCTTGVTQKGK